MTFPTLNLAAILPEAILLVGALLILIVELAVRKPPVLGWLGMVAIVGSLAALLLVQPADVAFQSMALADGLGRVAAVAILIAAGLAVLLALGRLTDFTSRAGAYYALLLLAATGMLAMVKANDFLVIFLGLEIFSIALYVLVSFNHADARSAEGGLKYLLLGAFASGFLLYGIALVYAATGSTNLSEITMRMSLQSNTLPFAPLLPVGVGLLLVGYGFKLALVPFHMWAPDAYQGAPTTVTAFMSVATKSAVFASLIRVLGALVSHDRPWLLALGILAVLTMTLGNLAALRQISVKRMLAYSSVAHAGYLLTGVAANNPAGAQGALYYVIAYTFMTLGAFAVLLAVQRGDEQDVDMDRLTGLAARRPALAVMMAIFMFSLAGIPPLAGFFGKLYVFTGAVESGMAWLAIAGVINSAIGAYYYLRVTVSMFMSDRAGAAEPGNSAPVVWASILLCAVGTVLLGLWQTPWMQGISEAIAALPRW